MAMFLPENGLQTTPSMSIEMAGSTARILADAAHLAMFMSTTHVWEEWVMEIDLGRPAGL